MKFSPSRFFGCSFVTAIVALLGFGSYQARAGSFLLNEQSVSGLGSAYAGGAAQAEDASTIFFNPAGIALLQQGEFQAGFHYVMSSGTFSNEGSSISAPGTPFNGAKVTGGNIGFLRSGQSTGILPREAFARFRRSGKLWKRSKQRSKLERIRPDWWKRSEERASLAFRGVKSRLLFQATSCAQTRFSVAQFRR
jgi:hypothetical protein